MTRFRLSARALLAVALGVLAAAGTSACRTAPAYWPNATNVPQLRRAGHAEVTAWGNTAGFVQAQIAAAVTGRLVVVAGANYADGGRCTGCIRRMHQFTEVGVGTYSSDRDDNAVSFLAGFGMGRTDWVPDGLRGVDLLVSHRAVGNYSRAYVQAASVSPRQRYDVAPAFRLTGVFFSAYEQFVLDTAPGPISFSRPQAAPGRRWSLYAEPSLRIMILAKGVRIGPQFGFVFPLNSRPAFSHQAASANIGLNVGGR